LGNYLHRYLSYLLDTLYHVKSAITNIKLLPQQILLLEKDKKELEAKIEEIQSDRVRMQSTIFSLEAERDDVIIELKQVVLERNSSEQRLAELEDMLGEHDQLEEGFHSLRIKVCFFVCYEHSFFSLI